MTGASQAQHTFAKASQRKKFENHCTNLFQISEIRANLSVCKRADLVLCKSKRRKVEVEALISSEEQSSQSNTLPSLVSLSPPESSSSMVLSVATTCSPVNILVFYT